MSATEKQLLRELKRIMEITGESNPVEALRIARKKLEGRKTTYSRQVSVFHAFLDIYRELNDLITTAKQKGFEEGVKYVKESENPVLREKKEKLMIKLFDRLDPMIDKIDKALDIMMMTFGQQQVRLTAQQMKQQMKVKPEFKVEISE